MFCLLINYDLIINRQKIIKLGLSRLDSLKMYTKKCYALAFTVVFLIFINYFLIVYRKKIVKPRTPTLGSDEQNDNLKSGTSSKPPVRIRNILKTTAWNKRFFDKEGKTGNINIIADAENANLNDCTDCFKIIQYICEEFKGMDIPESYKYL